MEVCPAEVRLEHVPTNETMDVWAPIQHVVQRERLVLDPKFVAVLQVLGDDEHMAVVREHNDGQVIRVVIGLASFLTGWWKYSL